MSSQVLSAFEVNDQKIAKDEEVGAGGPADEPALPSGLASVISEKEAMETYVKKSKSKRENLFRRISAQLQDAINPDAAYVPPEKMPVGRKQVLLPCL